MFRPHPMTDLKDKNTEIPSETEGLLLNAKELDELAQQLPPQEFKRFMKSEFLGHQLPYADEQKICCDTPELQIRRLGKKVGFPEGLVVFSLWNKTTKTLGISFRGTKDKPSIGRDLESNPGHDTFHKGSTLLSTEINLLLGEIERTHPTHSPDITIDIYGHSLGGADAQRCVGLLLKNILEWSDQNVEQAVTYFNKIKCLHLHCLNTPGIAVEDADNALQHLIAIKSKSSHPLEIICDWIDGANDLVQAAGDTNLFANVLDEKLVKHSMLHIEHAETDTNWFSSVVFFVYHFTQRAIKAHTGTAFTTQSNIAKWFYATNATLKGAKFINAKATNKSVIDTSHVGKIVKNFLHACYTLVVPDTSKESSDPTHLPQQPFILIEHEDSVVESKTPEPAKIAPTLPAPRIEPVNIHLKLMEHKTKEAILALEQDTQYINEVDNRGLSLLQLAAREGLNDAVICLCFKGAKLSAAVEAKQNNPIVLQHAVKSPLEYAYERGHSLIIKILKAFTVPYAEVESNILKSLYVWAIKNYSSPAGLTLPAKPTQEICQGLLELAAFLNKPLWAECILTCHENFQLRHNANVRTPAYWAALHHDDALFKKLCLNENNLLLTLWQLKQDKPDLFPKYVTPEIQLKLKDIFKYLPEDKENLTSNSKYAYLAALKNDADLVKEFSHWEQSGLKNYALSENSFVAFTVMQNCLNKEKSDFLASSLHRPTLVEYELITQNQSYYDFLLALSPRLHQDFLNRDENKLGLLNFLLSLHILEGFLTDDKMNSYLVLNKNDKLVTELAERHIQDRAAYLHRPYLFNDLGVPLLNRKEKKGTIQPLSDDSLRSIFKFLTCKQETKEQKHQKTCISLANSRIFALISETTPDKIGLPKLKSEIKRTQDSADQLLNEINALTRSKNQLMFETLDMRQRANRRSRNWTIACCIALPGTIAAHTWYLYRLINDKNRIAQAVHSTQVLLEIPRPCENWGETLYATCSTFISTSLQCNPYKGTCWYSWWGGGGTIDIAFASPDACNDLCHQADENSLYYKLSIASAVIIPLFITSFLIWRLVKLKNNYDANYFGELHRYAESLRNKVLSQYSKLFRSNIPPVSLLLSHPIDEKTPATDANLYIQSALELRKKQYLEYSTENRYATARMNIFKRLFQPDAEHKEVKSEAKQDIGIDILEPFPIPHQGSINDDLNTSLLVREEKRQPAPRRSLCPSCVIQ